MFQKVTHIRTKTSNNGFHNTPKPGRSLACALNRYIFRKELLCVIKLKASRQTMRPALIRLNQPVHKK